MSQRDYARLREQDGRDVRQMAYANTHALHYSTKTPQCGDPTSCDLCSNAARLAVQWYRPLVEKRIIEDMQRLYDVRCPISHPSSDG